MNRLTAFLCLLCSAIVLYAVPATPDVLTVTQPDGTTMEIRLYGDEFYHYATTTDGCLVTENGEGVYEYAHFDSTSGQIRPLGVKAHSAVFRTAGEWAYVDKNQARQVAQAWPHLAHRRQNSVPANAPGTRTLVNKVLVILAEFQDVSFSSENTPAEFDRMMNADDYDYAGSQGSVKRYFADQSAGKYTPRFDVVGPVKLPQTAAYYGADNGSKQDARIADMIMDACEQAHTTCNVDFSNYDENGDRFVDCVYVLYAGRGQADGGGANTVWPKNWDLVNAIYYGYVEDRAKYMQTSTTVLCPTYENVRVNVFVCSNELRRSSQRAGIGTFCHEFSHVLGLPDYYSTVSQNDSTPCYWSLMDIGMYNNSGITPPNYSAHDKYYFGWAQPTMLNKQENVVLQPDKNDYRMMTRTGAMKSATSSDTVFYFENRQKQGWDAYLPGHGLLVTRVAYNATRWTQNQVNVNSLRYAVVPADGKMNKGDSGDAFPGTANVTEFAPFAAYPLTAITETNGQILFKVCGGYPDDEYGVLVVTENCREEGGSESVAAGTAYVSQLIPDAGYQLLSADCFYITMAGNTLEYGVDFTYDGTTLTVPNVTGEMEILVIAEPASTSALTGADAEFGARVVNDPLGLRLTDLPLGAEVHIYDALGRLLVAEQSQTAEKVYALPCGVYLIRIEADRTAVMLKAVKQ